MGILDSMATRQQPQPIEQQEQPMEQQMQQGGDMGQMYQILMDNSMNAIAGVAEERIRQKGVMEGVADLVATAMVANLQAANQNGKAIPPQVLMQVAKDVASQLLRQVGVPEEEFDDVLIDILFSALEQFGDMSQGLISAEEEQQYVAMINQIAQLEEERQGQMQQSNQAMIEGE